MIMIVVDDSVDGVNAGVGVNVNAHLGPAREHPRRQTSLAHGEGEAEAALVSCRHA